MDFRIDPKSHAVPGVLGVPRQFFQGIDIDVHAWGIVLDPGQFRVCLHGGVKHNFGSRATRVQRAFHFLQGGRLQSKSAMDQVGQNARMGLGLDGDGVVKTGPLRLEVLQAVFQNIPVYKQSGRIGVGIQKAFRPRFLEHGSRRLGVGFHAPNRRWANSSSSSINR